MRSIVNRSDAGHILRRYRRFFFLRHRSQFMQQLPRRFTVRIRFLLTDCCFPAACDARLSPALFLPLSRKRCSCKGLQNFFRRQFYEAGMLKRPPEGLRRNRRRFLIMIAPREEALQRLPLILASNVQSGTATEAAIGAILLAQTPACYESTLGTLPEVHHFSSRLLSSSISAASSISTRTFPFQRKESAVTNFALFGRTSS